MDGKSDHAEAFEDDTVRSGDYLLAAVEAELHADATEEVLDEETVERVAERVEERLGLPVRLAHESEVDPSFEMSVYHRGDGEFPGLLLTTSVALDDTEASAALEELKRRRDTLSRLCEDADFSASVVDGEDLAARIERRQIG